MSEALMCFFGLYFDCRSPGGTTCLPSWRCQQCCSCVCYPSSLRVLATCWWRGEMRQEQKEVLHTLTEAHVPSLSLEHVSRICQKYSCAYCILRAALSPKNQIHTLLELNKCFYKGKHVTAPLHRLPLLWFREIQCANSSQYVNRFFN